jgi:hypothetical protein
LKHRDRGLGTIDTSFPGCWGRLWCQSGLNLLP